MILTDNIKRTLSIFGAFFIIFLSFFMFSLNNENKAFADTSSTSYSFQSSNVNIAFTPYVNVNGNRMPEFGNAYSILYGSFIFSFSRNQSTNNIELKVRSYGTYSPEPGTGANLALWDFTDSSHNYTSTDSTINGFSFYSSFTPVSPIGNLPTRYMRVHVLCNDFVNFNCDIYKIRLYSDYHTNTGDSALGVANYNRIVFYDTNDNFIQFSLYYFFYGEEIPGYSSRQFALNDRTYFLKRDLTDSQIYNTGFSDGQQSSQPGIFNDGFNQGQNIGYNNGYSAGYNQGSLDSGNYSFFSLIAAVVDVPISAFSGLFNFEIFGFNIKNFILSLFTLCVVIVIIRLVMGR